MDDIFLACDNQGLTGLWFRGQKYFARGLQPDWYTDSHPHLTAAREWLQAYFRGQQPDFTPPLHLIGTPFQLEVWNILLTIPYGQTMTYGQIANRIAQQRGIPRVSARAVGSAVGHNPISIIVPCHRVIGSDGSLTGYAGGLERKECLLTLEGIKFNS